jgi:hypothetical protein
MVSMVSESSSKVQESVMVMEAIGTNIFDCDEQLKVDIYLTADTSEAIGWDTSIRDAANENVYRF